MMIQPGDILLCRTPWSLFDGGSYVSWAIRRITHSNWSHVAWVYDEDHVLEALPAGTRLTKLSSFPIGDHTRVKVVRIKEAHLTQEQVMAAVELAKQNYKGNDYDYWLLPKLAWYIFRGLRAKKALPDDPNRSICSEDIAMPLWALYQFLFHHEIPAINTTPADIASSSKVKAVRE